MKINKFKKILIGSLIATTSASAIIGVSTSLILNNYKQTQKNETGSNLSYTFGQQIDSKNAYSAKIVKTTDQTKTSYKLTIQGNDKKEGKIFIVGKDGKSEVNEIDFTPGETIKIGIKLNKGYEKYTARELKVFGLSENIFVPSAKVEGQTNMFQVVMPKYEDTIDKKTKESWFYKEGTPIKVIPTFIQESIGTNGSNVDWEHGAFHNSLNGYVYEMKNDITWTSATQEIYKTFENKEINNPIDIYFYLNGHTLTLDVNKLNLDIPSGWALHFYNNKMDTKDKTSNKYGEIIVPTGKKTFLGVGGAVVMGSSVKFRMYNDVQGITFINYDDKTLIVDDIKNDPVVRLGK